MFRRSVVALLVAVLLPACAVSPPPASSVVLPTATVLAAASATPLPPLPTVVSPPPATATAVPRPTTPPAARGTVAESVLPGSLVPPLVAAPARGEPPFAGQVVTVLAPAGGAYGPLVGPLYELRDEFEQATGARLEIVEAAATEQLPLLVEDLALGSGHYDAALVPAHWLGELAAGEALLPVDAFFGDGRFPAWEPGDVLPLPRSLLEYGGQRYMVPIDHDALVLYYRRDLLTDPAWRRQFRLAYGYNLPVPPATWQQLRDVAQFFDGKAFGPQEQPGSGIIMSLGQGERLFPFLALSAPAVLGPNQPHYWFDPASMQPLIASPGHEAALASLAELAGYGPEAMHGWGTGQAADAFLQGQGVLALGWGDLGGLAQQEGSQLKGRLGVAPLPGSLTFFNPLTGVESRMEQPSQVSVVAGGSWGGVISKYADAPEAAYFLLALMASREKALVYGVRGWDGIDPGRRSQLLPPDGSASLQRYQAAGWDATDAQAFSSAYARTFSATLQLPPLRLPGTFSYWEALDTEIGATLDGRKPPAEALAAAVVAWDAITDRLGREAQTRRYNLPLAP